jgi:YesN/AraC family two-component response regulator
MLCGRIAEGDSSSAEKALQELFTALVIYSEKDTEQIRGRSIELLSLISRAAVDGGADGDTILTFNQEYLASINSAKEAEMYLLQLTRAVRKFARLVQEMSTVEHVDVISRVRHYIQRNYSQKVTLEEAAAQVNLSPSYLSKIFRREMGIGFITYLNKMRVEKSKILLQNRNIELVEAGGMVGYEDQSYFTRMFKRFTGIPPGKYREQRGRYPSDSQEIHVDGVHEN